MKKWALGLGLGFIGLLVVLALGFKSYTYSQTDDIFEAVIRNEATNKGSNTNSASLAVFFVQLQGQDPSPAFLQRFQGAPFSIRRGSQGKMFSSGYTSGTTTDITTGEKGVVLKLKGINWIMPSRPLVSAGGYVFEMTHEYGTWRVANVMIYTLY